MTNPSTPELPTRLEKSNLRSHELAPGETEIVVLRHGPFIRDREHARVGSLTTEGEIAERDTAVQFFDALIGNLPPEEREHVHLLIVASDTQYRGGGRRSYETATLGQQAADEVFDKYGMPRTNIINELGHLQGEGGPKPMRRLQEPRMFTASPDFVDFLTDKYGDQGLDFWLAFEEDKEAQTREAMGAEGPDDLADRLHMSVDVLARYARQFHAVVPNARLVVWAVTHYDTISPYVKRDILHTGKESTLKVDNGAGFVVHIDQEGNATTQLGNEIYAVPAR